MHNTVEDEDIAISNFEIDAKYRLPKPNPLYRLANMIQTNEYYYSKISPANVNITKHIAKKNDLYFEAMEKNLIYYFETLMYSHYDKIYTNNTSTNMSASAGASAIASPNKSSNEPPLYIISIVYQMHRFLIDTTIPINEPIFMSRKTIMNSVNNACSDIMKFVFYVVVQEYFTHVRNEVKHAIFATYSESIDICINILRIDEEPCAMDSSILYSLFSIVFSYLRSCCLFRKKCNNVVEPNTEDTAQDLSPDFVDIESV